jgi:hypothetical protein
MITNIESDSFIFLNIFYDHNCQMSKILTTRGINVLPSELLGPE